jgi:hypothetical protein
VPKAPELAPGLEVASWSNHEAGAMVTDNPGEDVLECGNYVTTVDRDLLLLPCPDARLYAHGGS